MCPTKRCCGGELINDIAIRELAAAANTQANADVINGSTSKQVAGLTKANTIKAAQFKTDADSSSPSAALVHDHVTAMLSTLATASMDSTHIVMHPRRLLYMARARTTGGEFVFPELAMTMGSSMSMPVLAGVPVISDSAVPTNLGTATNQDTVITFHAPYALVLETPLLVWAGDPDLRKWTATISAGRRMAFRLRYDTAAAAVRGTVFADLDPNT